MSRDLALACAALASAACVATGCDASQGGGVDLERMIVQARYEPYAASTFFADGRAMRSPPDGTVARGARVGDPLLSGRRGAGFATEIPVPLTRELLSVGRTRFEIHCAPCHGILGDGVSRVAMNMTIRKPPSLVGTAGRSLPPGRVFEVISSGYGMMRPYLDDVPTPEQRWAVVAYVRALGISAGVPVASLPDDVRRRAEEALR